MPKAYWIAHVTITDPERYAGYQAEAPKAFAKFNARFLARGGASENLEGPAFERHVVIEFNDLTTAHACYHSPEYQSARLHRASACEAHIAIVEGLEV